MAFDKGFLVVLQSVIERGAEKTNTFKIIQQNVIIEGLSRNQGTEAWLWPCIFCRSIVALELSKNGFL